MCSVYQRLDNSWEVGNAYRNLFGTLSPVYSVWVRRGKGWGINHREISHDMAEAWSLRYHPIVVRNTCTVYCYYYEVPKHPTTTGLNII